MTFFLSVPGWLQPSWPQGSGPSLCPFLPPLLLWSYTVGHKLWEICSLLSLCVDVLSFFDKQLPCSDCSETHLWFWAKERKLTLLHFEFWGVLFLFYKQHGRCILCLVILVGACFFLFQGGWASQAIQRKRESRGHSSWKEWFAALGREEAKLCVTLSEFSGWQGNILEFSFIFSAAEKSPHQSPLT